MDLGKEKVSKIFWKYAIPSILVMIIQSTASFIDSVFIGRYVGANGLSAIALVFPIILLLIGLGAMIAIGGTTIAGIEKGAQNNEKSNNLFNVTTSLLAFTGVASTILIYLFIPQLLGMTNVTGETLILSISYARTIGFFAVFFLLSFSFGFFLKLDGMPVLMVVAMLTGTVTNIFLDYLLIVRFDLGVQGAAIATGLSQVLPVIIMVSVIIFKSSWIFKLPKFHISEIKAIFYNGISELMSNISYAVTGLIFNFYIMNSIGSYGVAAYAVAMQISGIVGSIGYGFGEANQAAISYNVGAKQYKRVSLFFKITQKVSLLSGLVLTVLIYVSRVSLASLFINDAATLSLATNIFKYVSVSFILVGSNIGIGTFYTAINDPLRSGFITFYRSFLSKVIGLIIFPYLFGANGIWLVIIFSEVSSFVIGMTMYKINPLGPHSQLKVKKKETVHLKLDSLSLGK
jgi:putative MATE family efflux protein